MENRGCGCSFVYGPVYKEMGERKFEDTSIAVDVLQEDYKNAEVFPSC